MAERYNVAERTSIIDARTTFLWRLMESRRVDLRYKPERASEQDRQAHTVRKAVVGQRVSDMPDEYEYEARLPSRDIVSRVVAELRRVAAGSSSCVEVALNLLPIYRYIEEVEGNKHDFSRICIVATEGSKEAAIIDDLMFDLTDFGVFIAYTLKVMSTVSWDELRDAFEEYHDSTSKYSIHKEVHAAAEGGAAHWLEARAWARAIADASRVCMTAGIKREGHPWAQDGGAGGNSTAIDEGTPARRRVEPRVHVRRERRTGVCGHAHRDYPPRGHRIRRDVETRGRRPEKEGVQMRRGFARRRYCICMTAASQLWARMRRRAGDGEGRRKYVDCRLGARQAQVEELLITGASAMASGSARVAYRGAGIDSSGIRPRGHGYKERRGVRRRGWRHRWLGSACTRYNRKHDDAPRRGGVHKALGFKLFPMAQPPDRPKRSNTGIDPSRANMLRYSKTKFVCSKDICVRVQGILKSWKGGEETEILSSIAPFEGQLPTFENSLQYNIEITRTISFPRLSMA
ncbi:hypothetical protein C8R44DRAFT_916770 [Mycena epipterygia]|nr:hypothetical protein C8R44DRAFT_916770 [Mycena epipterygia]